jgi:hypothetical protein
VTDAGPDQPRARRVGTFVVVVTVVVVTALVVTGVVLWTRALGSAAGASPVTISGEGLPEDVRASPAEVTPTGLPTKVFAPAQAFELTPAGRLGTTATVTFEVGKAPRSGDEPLVVTSESDSGPWTPLETEYDAAAGTATVRTDHFSFFLTLWAPVRRLTDAIGQIVAGLTGGFAAEPDEVTCDGPAEEYELEVLGDAFSACVGTHGPSARPAVTLVNLRRYPMVVHPSVGEAALADRQFSVSTWLSEAGLGPNDAAVPAGGSVHYYLSDSVGLYGEFDGAANSVNNLLMGVTVAADLVTRFGYSKTGSVLDTTGALAEGAACSDAFTLVGLEVTAENVRTVVTYRNYSSSGSYAFTCVGNSGLQNVTLTSRARTVYPTDSNCHSNPDLAFELAPGQSQDSWASFTNDFTDADLPFSLRWFSLGVAQNVTLD